MAVDETGESRENHRPVASHWQTSSRNVVSSTPRIFRLDIGTVPTVWYSVLTVWYSVPTVWYFVSVFLYYSISTELYNRIRFLFFFPNWIRLGIWGTPLYMRYTSVYDTPLSMRYVSVREVRLCPWGTPLSMRYTFVREVRQCPWGTSLSVRYASIYEIRLCPWGTPLSMRCISLSLNICMTSIRINYIQIYHAWEGYLRKIPVERRKISRAEWREKFSLKTVIFRKYPSQTWYICLITPNII